MGDHGVRASPGIVTGHARPAPPNTLARYAPARLPRTFTTLLVAVVLVVGALIVAGCRNGNDVSAPEETASNTSLVTAQALGSAEAERELERRHEAQDAPAAAPPLGLAFGDRQKTRTAIERMQDRAFDALFRNTLFDKAIDRLPFRKAPLHVRQWVTIDPSYTLDTLAQRERFYRMSEREQARLLIRKPKHTLYARVDPERFYAMSERARAAAVKAFYRDAQRAFETAGIRDFVLVVTPLSETIGELPALAVGREGSASLTLLGRARSADGV